MKIMFVVLDGLADRPAPQLNGLTPLKASRKPNLDTIATRGVCGLLYPVSPGLAPSSEIAHISLFGYDRRDFPGRGYLEALGLGLFPTEGDVAFQASLVSVKEVEGEFEVVNRNPVCAMDECETLFRAVKSGKTGELSFELHPVEGREAVLLLRGAASPEVTDCDLLIEDKVAKSLPLDSAIDRNSAEKTARAVNQFSLWAFDMLNSNPINKRRTKRGDDPMNFILVKWAGSLRKIVPFGTKYGLKACSIASSNLFRGLARYVGMDFVLIDLENSGKDLSAKLDRGLKLLEDYDFVHVHTKAPDVAAHKKDPSLKKDVIEELDASLEPLIDRSDLLTIVTTDHATLSTGDSIHSGEPVPFVIKGQLTGADNVKSFDEFSVVSGALGTISGKDVMNLILNYSERSRYLGSKPHPFDSVSKPVKIVPLRRE